jgi:Plavaka transposase
MVYLCKVAMALFSIHTQSLLLSWVIIQNGSLSHAVNMAIARSVLSNLSYLEKIYKAHHAIYNTIDDGPTAYAQACATAGIKPVQHPFWHNLPFLDIFCLVTPDILHQLYQGLIKHILLWLKDIYGAKEMMRSPLGDK